MKDSILVNGAPLTRQDFLRTIPEFGIMPFWFVNGGMDYDEMEYQLREYKNKGIPGIFFHARFGILNTIGYLTKDWFDRQGCASRWKRPGKSGCRSGFMMNTTGPAAQRGSSS